MRTTRGLFAVLAILMCASLSAAAQQTWYVQSADWGWNNRRTDVTNTVRRLVSGPNFQANKRVFGDPAVGKDKTLNIVARDQRGNVRTFTYNEGSTVNSRMFVATAWGGPGWNGGGGGGWNGGSGGSLRILQAEWRPTNGTPGRNVTSRLQGMVRNDRLDITADNKTMGGDPAQGQSKQLYIAYEYRGRRSTTTVGEGGRVNIP